jgi:hypothetical protein
MAKIYSQANLVIVWLGEAAEFSDQALEQILAAGRDTSTRLSSNNVDQIRCSRRWPQLEIS